MEPKTFDKLAGQWNKFRLAPSHVLTLLPQPIYSSIVLDAGCANGRNSVFFAQKARKVYGIDSSKKMLEFAEKNSKQFPNIDFRQQDVRKMLFENDFFTHAYCLATIHLLKTTQDQLLALKELHRVLKKGGVLCVSVWNFFQPKFSDLKKSKEMNYFIDWRTPNGVEHRFYHFFTQKELEALVKKAGFKKIESFYEKNGEKTKKNGAANLLLTAVK